MNSRAHSLIVSVVPGLRFAAIAALFVCSTLTVIAQEQPIPAELSFLNKLGKPYRITYEPWTEMRIPSGFRGDGGVGKVVRGKHWQFPVILTGIETQDAIWALVKPAYLANGWTSVHEWTSGGIMMLAHYQKDGVEAWAVVEPRGPERTTVDMVEMAPMPFKFALTAPSATPEMVKAESGDIPWLGPLPGTKFRSSALDTDPFYIPIKGTSDRELVAPSSIIKTYYLPKDGLSSPFFHVSYHDALTAAGWTIVDEYADTFIWAHFTKNGRNIWAAIDKGEYLSIRVADAGGATMDLGKNLAANCHVAIYGVLFDFNKSTLQAASDPVLQQILDLLKKTPALKLEIQGHTDNVGNESYNQTLSEARAKAVVTWLTGHGVAAARLTSKGYGKTRPIADNATDAGRAKNRRVEIAEPGCTAKGK